MAEFILSFLILIAIVAGMAIGVMRGREPISGTCGGLNNIGVDGACEICGGNPARCEESNGGVESGSSTSNFYNAGER